MVDASRKQIDRRAEAALVEENMELVHYAVAEITGRIPRHVSRAELVSSAMVGLAQAARSFDQSRGIPFARYANTRIKGALLDDLRSRDWATRSVRTQARRVASGTDDLTSKLGRTPTSAEIGQHLDMDAVTVENVAADVHRAVVLNYDSLLDSGEAEVVLPSDDNTPEVEMLERERKAYLIDAVAALPERLRRVVVGYFFEELQMQTLADELGVTESRISQMRAEALELLRDGMNSQLEPDLVVEPRPGRVARRHAAYIDAVAAGSQPRARLNADGGRGRLLAFAGERAAAC